MKENSGPAQENGDEAGARAGGKRSPRYSGRLELTWTNKSSALLATEDGGYEWVEPHDHRVAEVRLFNDAGVIGDVGDAELADRNLLIRGDALNALRSLSAIPEYAERYVGQVSLAYIDPPFNTQQAFEQYDDALEHSVWLTMMRDRLEQIRRLLDPSKGSIWVHLDDAEMAYCRVLMDEIFGRDKFVATVVWQKRTSRENRAAFGSAHDYILIYAMAGATVWRDYRNRLGRGEGNLTNPDNDPRGVWESIPFTAQGFRKNQMYTIVTPTKVKHKPPKGRCWSATEPEYKKLLADNRIYFPKQGNGRPRVKQFPEEAKGLVPMTWWPAADVGDNDAAKKEILALFPDNDPFATPKPERLLRRIVEIATDPGDVVLDCFAGSGTTAAVAHKLGRRWITSERERQTIEKFTAPRLQRVALGEEDVGITPLIDWEGGGGFQVLDVAPSMYEDDQGFVSLAEWATNGGLAEATAAQLGYDYTPDPPFCGKRGRRRLAVIDGHLSEQVAEILLAALGDGETLDACAVGMDPAIGRLLEKRAPGSRARKIPQDIILVYRNPSAWRVSVARIETELEPLPEPAEEAVEEKAAAGGEG